MKYVVGIDVGGMSIKGGIVSADGKILVRARKSIIGGDAKVCLEEVLDEVIKSGAAIGIEPSGVGIGLPCVFDKKTGIVGYGNNVDLDGLNLKELCFRRYGLDVVLSNDAAAAALGEHRFGAGRGYDNLVLITIGTGVGCGIILGGKPINSNSSAVGELGHTVIVKDGRKCTCGRKGCLEAYASVTALYKTILREMPKNPSSMLWDKMTPDDLDGAAFFECVDKDATARRIYEEFIQYVGIGVVNAANLLRPDIILIGGAVSAQKEKLIKPLNEYLNANLFSKEYTRPIPLAAAENGNDAGILGAAALALDL